jgi:hypothetical protein
MYLLFRYFRHVLSPRRLASLAAVLSILVLCAYANAADLDTFCSKPPQQDTPQKIRDFYGKHCEDYLKSQVDFQIASFRVDPKNLTPLVAFVAVIGTLVGVCLTSLFANLRWRNETKFQIQNDRFTEGREFIDDLSELIGKRYFLLYRYLNSIIESEPDDTIDEKEKEYFKVVKTWNYCSRKNMNKIRLLIDDKCALRFLNFDDDYQPDDPYSLHYKFVIAHNAVWEVRKAKTSAQPVAEDVLKEKVTDAKHKVELLNWACSTFLESITTRFVKRAVHLQLLKVPTTEGPAREAFRRRFKQHDTEQVR